MTDQLSLLDLLPAEPPPRGPVLFDSPTRGWQERVAEWETWTRLYGHLDANRLSHAWRPGWFGTWLDELAPRCLPALLLRRGSDLPRSLRRLHMGGPTTSR